MSDGEEEEGDEDCDDKGNAADGAGREIPGPNHDEQDDDDDEESEEDVCQTDEHHGEEMTTGNAVKSDEARVEGSQSEKTSTVDSCAGDES